MPESHDPGLDERIKRALDRIEAPDLWTEASDSTRPSRSSTAPPSRGRRVLVATVAFALFAVPVALLLGGDRSHAPSPADNPSSGTVTVSQILAKTPGVRCTASMPAVVEP